MKTIQQTLLKFILLISVIAGTFYNVKAQKTNTDESPLKFPTPTGIKNQLLYLQRDPNTNTIIWELNVNEKGEIDEDEPVVVYWKRYDEDGAKKDLNYIQKKFAYGISTKKIAADKYLIHCVAYKKQNLYLMKGGKDGKFHIFAEVNNKNIIVDRIFIRIDGGSFWKPNVKYIEFKGRKPSDLTSIKERIIL